MSVLDKYFNEYSSRRGIVPQVNPDELHSRLMKVGLSPFVIGSPDFYCKERIAPATLLSFLYKAWGDSTEEIVSWVWDYTVENSTDSVFVIYQYKAHVQYLIYLTALSYKLISWVYFQSLWKHLFIVRGFENDLWNYLHS